MRLQERHWLVVLLILLFLGAGAVSNTGVRWSYASTAVKGDINGDGLLDLVDFLLALQVIAGLNPEGIRPDFGSSGADVNNDGSVGSEEAAYIIQRIGGIRNTAPVAKAGNDQSIGTGLLVTLDGSGSFDADGDLLTYSWSLTSTPPGSGSALSDGTAEKPTFTPDIGGTYVVRLVVNDGWTDSEPQTVSVAVVHQTVFNGGSLDNLMALSPTLTFENLLISGKLNLTRSAVLKVNNLTIAAEGTVGYSYTSCEYKPAPNFSVEASGKVVVDGEISLIGRSGTRVTSSSKCNSCYARDGGDVRITADEININGKISNSGGSGGTSRSSYGSSGCSGGDAGAIHLKAENIRLAGAALATRGGSGGTGYISGKANHGANGIAGPVELTAADLIQMNRSSISTDGTLTLKTARTNIFGPITYGQIAETIAGQTDEAGPELEVLFPLSDSEINIDEALEIRIRLRDMGVGIKEVQVTGFGYDETHSGSEIEDGILLITISKPSTPASLRVIARDNKGNSTEASVTGLSLAGNVTIAAGEKYYLDGDLDLGEKGSVNILGTMVIKRGSNPTITAGSLSIAESGRIEVEKPGESVQVKAPSLTFSLSGIAKIDGTVDLSGHDGLSKKNQQKGEIGGDFTLSASSISVSGKILSDGGDGRTREYGFPSITIGAVGDKGGTITLNSSRDVRINGTLSIKGGDGKNTYYGGCSDGSDGGSIHVSYGTTADVAGSFFLIAGGTPNSAYKCNPETGKMGTVVGDYQGPSIPAQFVEIDESEPNNSTIMAQYIQSSTPSRLFPPVQIKGSVSSADEGDLGFRDDQGNVTEDLEDLFVIAAPGTMVVSLVLAPGSSEIDLNLYVFNLITYATVASSHAAELGATERIENLELPYGAYIIGVSQFGEEPQGDTSYTLTVTSGGNVE